MTKSFNDILVYVKTISDIDRLISEIDLFEKSLYGDTQQVSNIRHQVLDTLSFLMNGAQNKANQLQQLREYLKNLKRLKITLAFEPSQKLVEKISNAGNKNIDSYKILSFSVDQKLLGGAVISYEGKFGDYSLAISLRKLYSEHGY